MWDGNRKFGEKIVETIRKQRTLFVCICAMVVFVTTYLLILPAITLDKDTAKDQGGIDLPKAEQVQDEDQAKDSDKSVAEAEDKSASEEQPAGELSYEGDGYKVEAAFDAKAGLPEDTSLEASEIESDNEDYDAWRDEALKAVQEAKGGEQVTDLKFAKFYDISLMADGQEVEPDAPVDITISYDKTLKAADADHVRIIHFGTDENGDLVPEVLDPDDVDLDLEKGKMSGTAFTAERFSVYGVVYTVDFAWEVDGKEYGFSLPGGGFISLQELVKALKVADDDAQDFVAEVESAEFSNPELLWVGKVEENTTVEALKKANELDCQYSEDLTEDEIDEINAQTVEAGDWALISRKPFDTEESLTISMRNGDRFVIKVTDAMDQQKPYNKGESFTAYDTRLDGFTINLFDYGPESSLDAGGNNLTDKRDGYNSGINANHKLKFTAYGRKPSEEKTNGQNVLTWNHFSGTDAATQGIVENKLNGGYPKLNGDESLAYLFNTTGDGENKKVYKNVSGLFQKDADGKYGYDSNENYAYYDSAQGDGGDFVLCDTFPEEGDTSSIKQWGVGFFPFNPWNGTKDCIHWRDYCPPSGGTNYNYYYNHHFGMTLDGVFQMTPNGKLNGNDMVFNFSGDDDLWVFIDDVLVLDIGGVHNPVGGSINFRTGQVSVDSAYQVNSIINDSQRGPQATTTIAQRFADAEKTWDPSPYSEHTIKVFYVERGGCYSNCRMEFNLTRFKDLEFDKKDQNGDPVPGAEFKLYKENGEPLMETYIDHEDNDQVKERENVSYADDEGHVKFDHVPVGKYIIRETNVPDGYVKDKADLKAVVYVEKNEDGTTAVLKSSVLRNGVETDTVLNIKKTDINISLLKQWKDNGEVVTPPAGTTASFNLVQTKTIVEDVTYTPEKKKATVRLLGANGQALCSDLVVEVGDTIKIDDYQLTQSGGMWSGNPSDQVLLSDQSIGTIQSNYNWGNFSSSDIVTYEIKEGDIDGNGQVVLKLQNKNRSDFRNNNTPDLSIESKGAPLPPVTEHREREESSVYKTFDLPYEGDWSRDFTVPMYDDEGNECKYYFEETSNSANVSPVYVDARGNAVQNPDGLKTNTDNSTQTIINNITRRTITATKRWDPDPPAGATITIELYKDGVATGNTITLDGDPDENGETTAWVATFTVLEDGALYTVEETGAPSGYELVSMSSSAVSGTNVWVPVNGLSDGQQYLIVQGNKALNYHASSRTLNTADISKAGDLITSAEASSIFLMTADGNGFRIHPASDPDFTIARSFTPWQYEEGQLKATDGNGKDRYINLSDSSNLLSKNPAQVELYNMVTIPSTGAVNYTLLNKKVSEPITADIKIIKTDSSDDHVIEGAVFKLLSGQVVIEPSGDNGIEFSVSVNDDGIFTVPEEGVTITGLPEGTYAIEEVSAPEGYIITNKTTEFTVEADGSITGKDEPEEGSVYEFIIPNPHGAELPSAGGPGITWIYLIGSILLLGCGTILAARRRI